MIFLSITHSCLGNYGRITIDDAPMKQAHNYFRAFQDRILRSDLYHKYVPRSIFHLSEAGK